MHQMSDTWDGFTLLNHRRRKERTSRGKQDICQFTIPEFWQNIPVQYPSRTSAPGAACMNVLILAVIQQQPAVVMPVTDFDMVAPEQLAEQFTSDCAEVTGENTVIILWCCRRFTEIPP